MSNIAPMTIKGAERLKEELRHLKSVERPRIIAAISEARAHGDLKENAEYHAAREEQGFIEGRIQDIEGKLGNCRVIDLGQIENEGKVVFGSTVTIIDIESEKKVSYQIVGVDEADLKAGKISYSSPIARGLVGKLIEDVVDIQTPNGLVSYEIVSVEFI